MVTKFFVFLVGLAFGSFANVVIFRIDNLRSILSIPSHCPHCQHRLAWLDLIPIVSFLLLRGRCRYCGQPISVQYPLVELALGVLAVLLLDRFGLTLTTLVHLLIVTALVILFVYDLKYMILPDVVLLPAMVLAGLGFFLRQGITVASVGTLLLGAVVGAGLLAILYFLGKGTWIGFGDVKFGLFLGILLGWPLSLAALFVAFTSGGLVSFLLLLMRRKTMRSQIPLGPFLVVGALAALLWGERLVTGYKLLVTGY